MFDWLRLVKHSKGLKMRIVLIFLFFGLFLHAEQPKLLLLKTYRVDMNVTGWVMSEKLDGVRAYWDGQKLISRSGRVFNAPRYFTRNFPPFAIDGELWSARGEFERIASIVNTKEAHDRWSKLSLHIFDVPYQKGGLLERLKVLQVYLQKQPIGHLKVIKQIKIRDKQQVKKYFDELINLGAEGIVIRNPIEPYYTGRTNDSLKHKPFMDAECSVLSIIEGKGKFTGQMGAIRCDYEGKVIKIGSGFTAKQRQSPPSIGTLISFKYYGLTHLGNPKYPVFLRVRLDEDLSVEK